MNIITTQIARAICCGIDSTAPDAPVAAPAFTTAGTGTTPCVISAKYLYIYTYMYIPYNTGTFAIVTNNSSTINTELLFEDLLLHVPSLLYASFGNISYMYM